MRKIFLLLFLFLLCQQAMAQGNASRTGDNILSGSNSFTGAMTACQENGVLYVGGTITCWAGANIGAQINAAYASAACPSTGCTISIVPQASGYVFTTPIVLNTLQKPASLVCGTPGGSKTGPVGGSCLLNYTPTTATTAITLDYLDTTGSGGTSYTAIKDITLSNNGCTTTGGCGSSALGVVCGSTNSGCGHGEFSNFHVSGFSEGVRLTSNNGWGVAFRNFEFLNNTTGFRQTVPQENTIFTAGRFLQNGTGMQLDIASEIYSTHVSWDGNTTVAINCGGSAGLGVLQLTGNHFENPALGTSHYITGNSCIPEIVGGIFAEDNTTGTTDFMIQTAAFGLSLDHPLFTTAGRTFTSAPIQANTPARIHGTLVNGSPATWTSTAAMIAGTSAAINLKAIAINTANLDQEQKVDTGAINPPNGYGLKVQDNTAAHVRVIGFGPNVCANDFWCAYDYTGTKTLLSCTWLSLFDCQFPGSVKPAAAGVGDLGTTLLPWGNLWLGASSTSQFRFQPPATAAARVITWTDPLGAANLPLTNNTSTTTTQVVHATATAGLYTTSAIATGDLPTAIPIGNIGSAGLSATAPIRIAATGVIDCAGAAACVTSAAALTNNVLVKGAGSQATQTSSVTDDGQTVTSTEFLRSANTVAVTANFTTASATLVTITGLSWTFGATQHNYRFFCHLSYSQATAAAANAFGVQATTTSPTNLYAAMEVNTALTTATAAVNATLPTLATQTATNIGTFTPSAFGAIGNIPTIFTAKIWGFLEQGAGATTLNIMALTGNVSDSLTIYRGSSCSLGP